MNNREFQKIEKEINLLNSLHGMPLEQFKTINKVQDILSDLFVSHQEKIVVVLKPGIHKYKHL